MAEFIAKTILLGQDLLTLVLVFMGLMTVIWTFQLLRDPAKQLDLAMELFKNIFRWSWRCVLFVWLAVLYILNIFKSIFTVTFATIRDFFVSKN